MLIDILDKLSSDIHGTVRQVFFDYDKVATGKTVESVSVKKTISDSKYTFDVSIGEGYTYIVSGRRAGSPPPPTKNLQEWASAVGFTGSIPGLAFFIGKTGIKAVDLRTPIEDRIKRIVNTSFVEDYSNYLTSEFQTRLNNIK